MTPTRRVCLVATDSRRASSKVPLSSSSAVTQAAISSHPDLHKSRGWLSQKDDNRLQGKLIYFYRKKKDYQIFQLPLHIHLLTPLLSTAVTVQVSVAMEEEKGNYSKWTLGSFYRRGQFGFFFFSLSLTLNYQAYDPANVNVKDCKIN